VNEYKRVASNHEEAKERRERLRQEVNLPRSILGQLNPLKRGLEKEYREGIVDKEQSVPLWFSVSIGITWLACPLLWLSECRLSFMIEYKIIWILQCMLYVHVQDALQHETVVMAVQ
jgi:hypothetical protein